jgi:hypothetical protein
MSGEVPIIRLRLNIHIPNTALPGAMEFLRVLNVIIAGESSLNYHMIPLSNRPIIYIPVFPYKRSEFTSDMAKLTHERVKTLKEFLSTYAFDKERLITLFYLRMIMIIMRNNEKNGIKTGPLFKIENNDFNIIEYADINKNTVIKYPDIKRYRLTDGSYISVWHDPYAEDSHAIICNLSKPFSEMRYQYNALHLYEHLMTYGWKYIDHGKQIRINGTTTINGISNVYAVLNTSGAMLEYMNRYIDFLLASRDKSFWINHKEMLRTETLRTISETRAVRSFSAPHRSDPAAYDCNYNIDIFCKWSNDPFDILLLTNEEIKLNINAINAKILSHRGTKIQPQIPTTAHIPVEALMDKEAVRVMKESPEKIFDDIMDNGCHNIPGKLYGIDNYMTFQIAYDIDYDYRLHALLYLHRFVKNIEYDKELVNTIILPRDYTQIV